MFGDWDWLFFCWVFDDSRFCFPKTELLRFFLCVMPCKLPWPELIEAIEWLFFLEVPVSC